MTLRKAPLEIATLAVFAGLVGIAWLSTANAADMYVKAPSPPPLVGPAVDGINGKIDGFGGTLGSRSLYGSKGSLSLPLGTQLGLQVDGTVGGFGRRLFDGVAGHLFWRDPAQALLGIYASYTHWNQFGGVNIGQVGVEGEYYWARWTLQGIVGVEFGNSALGIESTTVPFPGGGTSTTTLLTTIDVKTRFMDQINLKYYLTDNWAAYVGHRYLGGRNALALGSEAALPLGRGVMGAAFVEGRVGQHSFNGVSGGLRFYFGQKDKSLMARHRQDDPTDWGVDTLLGIIGSQGSTGAAVISCPGGFPPFNGSCAI